MSIIDIERDFTRPKGNSLEIRSKYLCHRARSALLLNHQSNMIACCMQQSNKVQTGKRKYKYIPPKENDASSRTRNKMKNVNKVISEGQGVKIKQMLVPQNNNPNTQEEAQKHIYYNNDDNAKMRKNRMNQTFLLQNCRAKQQLEMSKPPRMENDALKPKGYDKYEALVKNPSEFQRISNLSCSTKMYSTKEIKEKMMQSDIFFKVPCFKDKIAPRTASATIKREKSKSDIFFKVNDSISLNKSGEPYLFVPAYNDKYTNSKESKSNWSAKASNPTLLNHSNSFHHILNPGIKNISNTKQELLSNYNYNNYFISRKQKSLCEFIDLTRNGSPNPNQDYLSNYIKSKQCFHKTKNLCSSLIDLVGQYKNLVDKPFAPFNKEQYQYIA